MAFRGHVVAVPFPGRGHINPMLNVCKLLADRGLLVTFVVTKEWLSLLSSDPEAQLPENIQLRPIPNVLPLERERGAKYREFTAAVYTKMEPAFEQLLGELVGSPPVAGILADSFLPWAVAIGDRRNIKVASLFTQSAMGFAVFCHLDLIKMKVKPPVDLSERGEEIIDYIPGVKPLRVSDLHTMIFNEDYLPIMKASLSWIKKAHRVLFTSFHDLEPETFNYLKSEFQVPLYAVGPSIPFSTLSDKGKRQSKRIPLNEGKISYWTWLDSQPKRSVLYISLGSFMAISEQQMEEIEMALKGSGVHYFWVRRGSSSAVQGSNNKGLIVQWCEQLQVLCHPAVGGFMTHCGWNSTLEGVYAGLPMLAFPLSLDQFPNTKLIVDDWGIGMRLRRQMAKECLVSRDRIAECIKTLMDLDGDRSKEMRERAKDLQRACHGAIEEGGSSFRNLDAFISGFTKG